MNLHNTSMCTYKKINAGNTESEDTCMRENKNNYNGQGLSLITKQQVTNFKLQSKVLHFLTGRNVIFETPFLSLTSAAS